MKKLLIFLMLLSVGVAVGAQTLSFSQYAVVDGSVAGDPSLIPIESSVSISFDVLDRQVWIRYLSEQVEEHACVTEVKPNDLVLSDGSSIKFLFRPDNRDVGILYTRQQSNIKDFFVSSELNVANNLEMVPLELNEWLVDFYQRE